MYLSKNDSIIILTLGFLFTLIGISEIIPALVDFIDGQRNYKVFFFCSFISLFLGGLMILTSISEKRSLSVKQAFLLTTLSWFFISVFASLPLYLSDLHLSFIDALFEAISGITTTGSTILSGLDGVSRGILLWRSITQWIGGIGIIAFAIVILPFLHVGGMHLFKTESSDTSNKLVGKAYTQIQYVLLIYLILTFACALSFYYLGMDSFDAINHAMTTISTGGYSTHDASFGFFGNPALHYIAGLFMVLGGLPFVMYTKFFFGTRVTILKEEQIRVFMYLLGFLIAIMAIWLWQNSEFTFMTSLQYSFFNTISIITTTGFATTDYTLWGSFATVFFFVITFLGSCTGSTSGGIKTLRLIVVVKFLNRSIKKLIYPNGVFRVSYQNKELGDTTIASVLGFLGLFVVSTAAITLLLMFLKLDFETALSGAATALANVGPGIGSVIGPAGNFASLPDGAKIILSIGMILGRLEIMTVLVLFLPKYWRH